MSNYQVPEGYKQTEVGVISEDWDVYSLQSLTANSESITYGVLKLGNYVYNGILLLQIKDVIHGDIKAEELHKIGEQLDCQYSRTRLSGGEIVVSLVGTIGKVAYIPPFLLGANLHRNLAKISISEEHDSKFIFYQLKSERIQAAIKLTTFGSTQALFNLGDLRSLPIVVPPLPEQRAIAATLSDVDALIATLDKLIAKQRHLETATMQQLLTGKKRLPGFDDKWETYTIGDIGTVGRGRVISHREILASLTPQYPVYSSQTSNDGVMGYLDTYDFEGNYITWTTDGVNAGKVFYREGRFNCTNVCGTIKIKDFYSPFVAMALDMVAKNYVSTNLANPKLMNGVMKSIEIVMPSSIEEQRTIATVLSDMDAAISALETRRAKTQAIKQGMMQELLTGRTRLV